MLEDLNEIYCPITNEKFTLVKDGKQDNINHFNEWIQDILNRSGSGKKINLAIDCEGFHLGMIKNSLSSIQISEIFDDTFSIEDPIDPNKVPNIGSKPGFIILTPMNNEIKEKLTSVFNNLNTTIFTFDFTSDFSALIESGININMNNVFDSQLASHSGPSNFFICYMKIQPLSWFIENARNMDPLADKAIHVKNSQKNNYFYVSSFLFKDTENPSQAIVTKDLLIMGAADVYMTGLAAVYCFRNGLTEIVKEKTKIKVDEFKQYIMKYNNILAPAISRQIAFFNFHRYPKYRNLVLNDTTEKDLISLLEIFQDSLSLVNAHKVFQRQYKGKMDPDQAERLYNTVTQKLESSRSRLEEMLQKYS